MMAGDGGGPALLLRRSAPVRAPPRPGPARPPPLRARLRPPLPRQPGVPLARGGAVAARGPALREALLLSSHGATLELSDGRPMPMLGIGTGNIAPGSSTYRSVREALALGYRLVDTSPLYANEADVGRAIKDSGVPRGDIWVTTKLAHTRRGFDATLAEAAQSLARLGLDYLDLYLIHSPLSGRIVETWDALRLLQRRGLVRSVGVSNFRVHHLELLRRHGRPMPAVNQIEVHPLNYQEQRPLLGYCRAKGIRAFGSHFRGHRALQAKVAAVAEAHGRSETQVLLRWALQVGIAVIPGSRQRSRLLENMLLFDFELSDSDMHALGNLSGGSVSRIVHYWDARWWELPVSAGDVTRGDEL
mmetsp:Transcript_41347/g.128518  ORF Transcript_41347/g.128518 Transcript_41347/m.128518 type:complete len:360 (-) Transcript_41347:39-1118(-)